MAYENKSNSKLGENKPNQTQYKANTNPIFPDAQMNVTSGLTKHYENAHLRAREKIKPNQTQFTQKPESSTEYSLELLEQIH
ncbi:MAG: hypothetical protein JSV99_01580 [Planctomycetota bacterium]|nr:MAG: hypothetical protein JSV99_01580 [Planctomycetota bacterium]